MPQPRKAPDRRQRTSPTTLEVVPGGRARRDRMLLPVTDPPPPPAGLTANVKRRWTEFWGAPIAASVEVSERPALERLFGLYDEEERVAKVFRAERITRGSKGQPRLSPLGGYLQQVRSDILALEDRFGLNPKARTQLGIQFGEMHKTLEQLNREIDADRHEVEEEEDDPRIG